VCKLDNEIQAAKQWIEADNPPLTGIKVFADQVVRSQ
jgi:hypothetical protein